MSDPILTSYEQKILEIIQCLIAQGVHPSRERIAEAMGYSRFTCAMKDARDRMITLGLVPDLCKRSKQTFYSPPVSRKGCCHSPSYTPREPEPIRSPVRTKKGSRHEFHADLLRVLKIERDLKEYTEVLRSRILAIATDEQ